MPQYISKFSGVDIDRAVAYYKATAGSRVILKVDVSTGDWVDSSGSSYGKYKVQIVASGSERVSNTGPLPTNSNALDEPPQVYFIEDSGAGQPAAKWDLNYTYEQIDNNNAITCYSNKKIAGDIVIVSVLSGGSSDLLDDISVHNLEVRGVITQPSSN